MGRAASSREAKAGTLAPSAMAALIALQAFIDMRDRLAGELLGIRLHRNRLRDAVMRLVVLEHGYGRLNHLRFYEEAASQHGSQSAIRAEIHRLVARGMLVMREDPTDRRAMCVVPTQETVDEYSRAMPALAAEARRLFGATA